MVNGPGSTRFALVLFAALGLAAVIAVYGPHLEHSTDDGFITYRYARNLADGHGLVFNPGERHLGTTAPGWAVLLAATAVAAGTHVIPAVSGLASLAGLIAALTLLSRRLFPDSWIETTAAALILSCNRWLIEVLGHEGFIVALLAVVAVDLADRKRDWAAGLVWGAAFFMRPDSAVMGAASGCASWVRERRVPWRLLLGFVVTAGVVAAILIWLAGSAVPFSLQVKRAEASSPVLAVGAPYLNSLAGWTARTWGWAVLPLAVLTGLGWWRAVRDDLGRSLSILIPVAAMLLFFPIVGVPFAPWYLVVPIVGIVIGAAGGATALLRPGRCNLWVRRVTAVALVAASIAPTMRWAVQLGDRPPDPRAVPMTVAASWLAGREPVGGSVATIEVGFLGLGCQRPVLDLMGLGSPGALEALTSSGIADFFFDAAPAFFVENPTFDYLLEPILSDPRFPGRYRQAHVVGPTERYPVTLTIWQRRPGRDPATDSDTETVTDLDHRPARGAWRSGWPASVPVHRCSSAGLGDCHPSHCFGGGRRVVRASRPQR
jgi:hypothetical protein